MHKFPFKRDDRYIYRYEVTTATVMQAATVVMPPSAPTMATAIDVYGLRWEYTDGWWHEWYFLSRRVKR